MARPARTTRDIPGREDALRRASNERNRSQARVNSVRGKSFAELTPAEKDLILKQLAISAGLIVEDSD